MGAVLGAKPVRLVVVVCAAAGAVLDGLPCCKPIVGFLFTVSLYVLREANTWPSRLSLIN